MSKTNSSISSVWSRNRKILDDFVREARTHYFESPIPPRELIALPDEVSLTLKHAFPDFIRASYRAVRLSRHVSTKEIPVMIGWSLS